jgi:hypothetical protein
MKFLAKVLEVPTWKFDVFIAIVTTTLLMNFSPFLIIPEKADNDIDYISLKVYYWYVVIFVVSLPFFFEFVLDHFVGFFVPNYDTNTRQQTVIPALLIASVMLSVVIVIMFDDHGVSFRFAQSFTAFCQTLALCTISSHTIQYTSTFTDFVALVITLGTYSVSQIALTLSTTDYDNIDNPNHNNCDRNLSVALYMSVISMISYVCLTRSTWTPKEIVRNLHSLYAARAMNVLVVSYIFLRVIYLTVSVTSSQHSNEQVLLFKLVSLFILCTCGILFPGRVVRGTVLLLKVLFCISSNLFL